MSEDVGLLRWWKSSRCDNAGCVEVAEIGEHVAVRDSTQADGPLLTFSRAEWSSFVAGVRSGDFEPAGPIRDALMITDDRATGHVRSGTGE